MACSQLNVELSAEFFINENAVLGTFLFCIENWPIQKTRVDGSSICVIYCHCKCKVTWIWKPQLDGEPWGKDRVWQEWEIVMTWESDSKPAPGVSNQDPNDAL